MEESEGAPLSPDNDEVALRPQAKKIGVGRRVWQSLIRLQRIYNLLLFHAIYYLFWMFYMH